MKRKFTALLALCLTLTLTACVTSDPKQDLTDQINQLQNKEKIAQFLAAEFVSDAISEEIVTDYDIDAMTDSICSFKYDILHLQESVPGEEYVAEVLFNSKDYMVYTNDLFESKLKSYGDEVVASGQINNMSEDEFMENTHPIFVESLIDSYVNCPTPLDVSITVVLTYDEEVGYWVISDSSMDEILSIVWGDPDALDEQ